MLQLSLGPTQASLPRRLTSIARRMTEKGTHSSSPRAHHDSQLTIAHRPCAPSGRSNVELQSVESARAIFFQHVSVNVATLVLEPREHMVPEVVQASCHHKIQKAGLDWPNLTLRMRMNQREPTTEMANHKKSVKTEMLLRWSALRTVDSTTARAWHSTTGSAQRLVQSNREQKRLSENVGHKNNKDEARQSS
ncbi:hypothetical protein MSG28_009758 [Choristoneura fumiferana]|uniref:Uncharacterized protein n=1 Tax=Choristoneura fumiferana TaxID=7141 RepID=A0ACC0JCK5_CHOFU|nr:hypothetical protein MSG28_009758 [Choristoneura fumiferana]